MSLSMSHNSAPLYALMARLGALLLSIRHGNREKSIGRLRVGLLRHAGALARRRLVAVLTASGRTAGHVALGAARLVVIERVVERGSL